MRVLDRSAQRIDLGNQGGALTADVLQHLRNAMRLNDYFIHLSLSHNTLHDEELAVLSAIIKEKASLESLELCDCGLNNKSINFYLFPALMLHHSVIRLDLSKNDNLNDEIAESLSSYIANSELTELNLMGVPLSRVSGKKITHAMEHNNTTLLTCQLPYTVGFHNLDKAAAIVQRNRLSAQSDHTLPSITPSYKTDKRESTRNRLVAKQNKEAASVHMDECTSVLPETISWGKRDNKTALHDDYYYCSSSKLSSKHLNSNDMNDANNWPLSLITKSDISILPLNRKPYLSHQRKNNTNNMSGLNIDTLTNMKSHFLPPLTHIEISDFNTTNRVNSTSNIIDNNDVRNNSSIRAITQWADPTLQRTLVHLQTLHDRCALYDCVMAEQQRRLACDQGLGTEQKDNRSRRNVKNRHIHRSRMKTM